MTTQRTAPAIANNAAPINRIAFVLGMPGSTPDCNANARFRPSAAPEMTGANTMVPRKANSAMRMAPENNLTPMALDTEVCSAFWRASCMTLLLTAAFCKHSCVALDSKDWVNPLMLQALTPPPEMRPHCWYTELLCVELEPHVCAMLLDTLVCMDNCWLLLEMACDI